MEEVRVRKAVLSASILGHFAGKYLIALLWRREKANLVLVVALDLFLVSHFGVMWDIIFIIKAFR